MITDTSRIERFRREHPALGSGIHGEPIGFFQIPSQGGWLLNVIASTGAPGIPWDHVSVSVVRMGRGAPIYRTPTWDEMERVKRLFFEPTECAMQLHVPTADHINIMEHCLHLWRPHHQNIPLPPALCV